MFYEEVHVESPIVPDMTIATPDGRKQVVELSRLRDAELARLVPDEALRAAVVSAGRHGVIAWPGMERWIRLSASRQPVPAIDYNSHFVGIAHALDVLASPSDYSRQIEIENVEGTVNVVGVLATDFEKGPVGLASGQVGVPMTKVPEKARRLAWAQLFADLIELQIDPSMVSGSSHEWPEGAPPTASLMVYGDLAREHSIIASSAQVLSLDVTHPSAHLVAINPCSAWARQLATCIELRTANVFGSPISIDPPPSPDGLPTPSQLLKEIQKRRATTIAKMAAGVGAFVFGAWAGSKTKLLDSSVAGE